MSAGWVTSRLLSSCVEVGYFGSALPSWTWETVTLAQHKYHKVRLAQYIPIFLSKRIAAPAHMQSSSCHFDHPPRHLCLYMYKNCGFPVILHKTIKWAMCIFFGFCARVTVATVWPLSFLYKKICTGAHGLLYGLATQ